MHPKTKTILYYLSYLMVAVVAFCIAQAQGMPLWASLVMAFMTMLAYFLTFAAWFNWQAKLERRRDASLVRRPA